MLNTVLSFRLATKNILSAGLRTWLNIGVLSFAFVMILFFNGLMDGWEKQAMHDSTDWEYGNGQFLHPDYDLEDPFTIRDGHGVFEKDENLTPILLHQGNIYPQGRMLPVLIKGIDIDQKTLSLPTDLLQNSTAEIPAMLGSYMAKTANLKVGDQVLLRWKDKNGAFDARNITVVGVFDTNVPSVDIGQIWIPIETLWDMTGSTDHATILVANEQYQGENNTSWIHKSKEELLSDITALIETKKGGGAFMYVFLMTIALIAIFDSQVFSVFKRQKEIGTYIALGFTKKRVTFLFTLEGTMYAVLATIVGGIYSFPLFRYLESNGIPIPSSEMSYEMGIAISERMYPDISNELFFSSMLTVILLSVVVSYLPVRKISHMNPVDALKGKKL